MCFSPPPQVCWWESGYGEIVALWFFNRQGSLQQLSLSSRGWHDLVRTCKSKLKTLFSVLLCEQTVKRSAVCCFAAPTTSETLGELVEMKKWLSSKLLPCSQLASQQMVLPSYRKWDIRLFFAYVFYPHYLCPFQTQPKCLTIPALQHKVLGWPLLFYNRGSLCMKKAFPAPPIYWSRWGKLHHTLCFHWNEINTPQVKVFHRGLNYTSWGIHSCCLTKDSW